MNGEAQSEHIDPQRDVAVVPERSEGLRTLVVTSVEAEQEAVLRGLGGDAARFRVLAAGVGPAAAAAGTAAALMSGEYGLVINAGVAGGFAGQAEVGSLVVASEIVAADLGAESPERFISVDELGLGEARIAVDRLRSARLAKALLAAGLPVRSGPVLTVSTATGTAETAVQRAARVPGAAAEGMEGYGVAVAARLLGIPVLEIRAISNRVGRRDRSAWRIPEALGVLEKAFSIIAEVLV